MKNENNEQIKEFGTNLSSGIETITIIGQIEGHYIANDQGKATKYEHIIPLLIDAELNENIKGILIIVNTVGGDVEAGLAIAEMIASLNKPTVSLVIGGGHSIGVPISVAAKMSFIVPSATMTIHPVRTNGMVIGVPQSFSNFEKMQERITDFIVKHSNISKERFNKLLRNVGQLVTDVGTTINGTQAVDEGLIDGIGGINEALTALQNMYKKDKNDN